MSTSQTHALHRALLRPYVLHALRAAGFHSTKPSVLDTLVDLTERYLLLLATTTATHARNAHNEAAPTLADVRRAMHECGAFTPLEAAAQEEWREVLRMPVDVMAREVDGVVVVVSESSKNNDNNGGGGSTAIVGAGEVRKEAEKRKREMEDLGDVRAFVRWFDFDTGTGPYAEIRRVAGLSSAGNVAVVAATTTTATAEAAAVAAAAGGTDVDGSAGTEAPTTTAATAAATTTTAALNVGVGGSVVQAEDFLTVLKKKLGKGGGGGGGDESRLAGSVLGRSASEEKHVLLEGGPVQKIQDWKPPRVAVEVDMDGSELSELDMDELMMDHDGKKAFDIEGDGDVDSIGSDIAVTRRGR